MPAREGWTDDVSQGVDTQTLQGQEERAGDAWRATVCVILGGAGHIVFFVESAPGVVQYPSPAGPNPALPALSR